MVKGFVKTLEASIAIVLILISIVFLFPERTKNKTQISHAAYDCLKYIDNKGLLRNYAVNGFESNLVSDLRACISPLYDYTVKMCTSTACNSQLPSNKEVFLSSYIIAGEDTFRPTLINLWIWLR
jgi:hypothetical protein